MASQFAFMNDMSGPQPISSLPGIGPIGNGHSGQSVGGAMPGGMGGFDVMHTGRHTSTVDPVSNPRGTITTQFFMDVKNMNMDADVGNMELCWMDVESGPVGIVGQNKPHVFKSLTAMNRLFETAAHRDKYGDETNTRWFDKQYSVVGILRHEDPAGYDHAQNGNHTVCQNFATGYRVRMVDIFQACGKGTDCIEIGDIGYVILRKYPYIDEIERIKGNPNPVKGFQWRLAPFWSKKFAAPPVSSYRNQKDGTIGQAFRICSVAGIYGDLGDPVGSRAIARKYVYHPTPDGSYKSDFYKLRTLDVEICTTK